MKNTELLEKIKYKDIFDNLIYEVNKGLISFRDSNIIITNYIKSKLLIDSRVCFEPKYNLIMIYTSEKEADTIYACNSFNFKSYKNIFYKEYIYTNSDFTYIVV